jgi:copper oxidase (laccase) domain-containing protein
MLLHDWIVPDWPAPSHVHAVTTTRSGGVSRDNYYSMNPASHVNDDVHAVTRRESSILTIKTPTATRMAVLQHGMELFVSC